MLQCALSASLPADHHVMHFYGHKSQTHCTPSHSIPSHFIAFHFLQFLHSSFDTACQIWGSGVCWTYLADPGCSAALLFATATFREPPSFDSSALFTITNSPGQRPNGPLDPQQRTISATSCQHIVVYCSIRSVLLGITTRHPST